MGIVYDYHHQPPPDINAHNSKVQYRVETIDRLVTVAAEIGETKTLQPTDRYMFADLSGHLWPGFWNRNEKTGEKKTAKWSVSFRLHSIAHSLMAVAYWTRCNSLFWKLHSLRLSTLLRFLCENQLNANMISLHGISLQIGLWLNFNIESTREIAQ